MKVSGSLGDKARDIARCTRELEEAGVDSVASAEVNHDAFLPLMLAAEHTDKIKLMTSIVVAFARTPMALATVSHDLNAYSRGRFTLGLGSQVKSHIQWRYGMPWSSPAARMKEFVQALHAIWDSWYDDKPLEFRGEFYTHALMTPRFIPEDRDFGRPRVAVAAVGPLMTQAAASVADGMICHAFTTPRYMREVTLPAIEKSLKENGRKREAFEVIYPPFASVVHDDAELEEAKRAMRSMIAFYGSTPSYRGVLELHGWGDLQRKLQVYVKADRWNEIGDLIDDAVLNTFAVLGDAAYVAKELKSRFGGVVDRIGINNRNMSQTEIATIVADLASA